MPVSAAIPERPPIEPSRRTWLIVLTLWLAMSAVFLFTALGAAGSDGGQFAPAWLFATAAFLPAATLRNVALRTNIAIGALVIGVLMSWLVAAINAPGAGLAALVIAMPLIPLGIACIVLFGVGLAGAISRFVARTTHSSVAWYVTPVVAVLALAVLTGVPYGIYRYKNRQFYASRQAIVASALGSAAAQTQSELTSRVVEAVSAPSGGDRFTGQDDRATALLGLWHPGPRKNAEYFAVDPDNADQPYEGSLQIWIRDVCIGAYDDSPASGKLGDILPGDRFVPVWGADATSSELGTHGFRWLLSYYDDARWDGEDFRDGTPLFSGGRLVRLDIARERDSQTEPFLTLYAVDDAGKWWLVGIRDPNAADL